MVSDARSLPLTRGRLAALTGCHAETIRYYESAGLLAPPGRSAAGHRRYCDADVRRLHFVQRARDLGFPLAEIRDLLRLAESEHETCADVATLARRHLDGVRTRLAGLRRVEAVLARTVARCADGEDAGCPLIDALSDAPFDQPRIARAPDHADTRNGTR